MKLINGSVIIMLVLAVAVVVLAFLKDPGLPLQGFKEGCKMLISIFPAMLLAFMIAGVIATILPGEQMSRWLGAESGMRGLAIGTLAGALTPGGPFVQFPIVAALYKSGTAVGPLVSYISAWALLGVNRVLIFEIPILGWRLSLCRYAASLIFPFVIGLLSQTIWKNMQ